MGGCVMSQLNVDTIKNAAGTHERFPCTAWCKFNGIGTAAVDDSGNMSSITDNGVGNFTFTFDVALDNATYAFLGSSRAENVILTVKNAGTYSTTAVQVYSQVGTTGAANDNSGHIAIFGGLS